ncbi:hypothetical protein WJS89_10470 [Sphingomicrobium sp. XHP0235]|uniref:hypothetical protein n=1 Tax=Sphingomicrobium aquimarinum TaxID=3133971 RepID=UPI0031FE6419
MTFARPHLVSTLMLHGNELGTLNVERIAYHQNEALGRTSGDDGYWTAADLRKEWQQQHETYQAIGTIARWMAEDRLVVRVSKEVVDE